MEEKNMAPFRQSSVSSIRGGRITSSFRDAIQLAIIDAKRQLPSFFLTSTMGDDQGLFQRVDDTFIKSIFCEPLHDDASFSRRDSVGSLVDWSTITSKILCFTFVFAAVDLSVFVKAFQKISE
ncbi:hypothetical protein TNCV_4177361 [Trichonephila clavipes]|nr:hypothetical protein TNCV_4177361 [Trichonephila clavipes]